MSHRFDATLKGIVAAHPGDFAAVFGLPTDKPPIALNVDLSTISAATDVALGFGNPLREVADLNFQSGPDLALPARADLYSAALHFHYGVPVRSILVLLRPKADGANLTGKLAYGVSGQRVEFEYGVVRLWQEPVERYLRGGLAALPLATLCQMPANKPLPEALREVVQEINRRLGAEASHAEAARLMTAAYILSGLRIQKSNLASIYQGVGLMQEYTAYYDEVMEEGIARGQVKQQWRTLRLLGRERLGSLDAETESALTAIKDLDRLERMTIAIFRAESWDELLATP